MVLKLVKKMLTRRTKLTIKRYTRNILESISYKYLSGDSKITNVKYVIFVCKGNICRSVFAEYYFKKKLLNTGIQIKSCGIDVDQGTFPPPQAVVSAEKFNLSIADHESKKLCECEFRAADLILAMEFRQYRALITLFPEKKENIRLLREFSPRPTGWFCNIYDPYGLDSTEFNTCFRLIQKSLDGLEKSFIDF